MTEGEQRERLDAFTECYVIPASHVLLLFIMVPRIERQHDHLMINIYKACILQRLNDIARTMGNWSRDLLGGFFQIFVPDVKGGGLYWMVITARFEVNFDLFEPGTRTEMVEYPSVERFPGSDTTTTHLHMDDVPSSLSKLPKSFVIEGRIEIAVFGAIEGLNGSKVDTNDVSIGKFDRDVQSPDAGATTQVQYSRVWGVWGVQQTIPVSSFGDDLVEDI